MTLLGALRRLGSGMLGILVVIPAAGHFISGDYIVGLTLTVMGGVWFVAAVG